MTEDIISDRIEDIVIVGTGIMGIMQMTLEAKEILKTREKIFVLHYDNAIYKYIEDMGIEVIDATLFYENNKDRGNVYKDIALSIIEEAKVSKVGFLVHGHPLFIVSTSEHLLNLAKINNLSIKVVPGVSSLDTVIVDLKLDLGYAMQSYEANYMLANNPQIENKVPLLIFQAAILGNSSVKKDYVKADLSPLKEYLLRFYHKEHIVKFILSSKNSLFYSDEVELKIVDLENTPVDFLEGRPTLYVPPIEV